MTGGISMSSNIKFLTGKPTRETEFLETLGKVKRSLRTFRIVLHFPFIRGGGEGYPGESRRVSQRW